VSLGLKCDGCGERVADAGNPARIGLDLKEQEILTVSIVKGGRLAPDFCRECLVGKLVLAIYQAAPRGEKFREKLRKQWHRLESMFGKESFTDWKIQTSMEQIEASLGEFKQGAKR